jgi:hypothetical protein
MGKKYKKNLKKKHIYAELQKIDSGQTAETGIASSGPKSVAETSSTDVTDEEVKEMDKVYSVTLPDLKKFLFISLSLVAILVIVTIFENKTSFLLNIGDKVFNKLQIFQLQ